ncbi:hypothetical protein Cni_G13493 [Canna indica]|uniref:Uncharacterized protein n=1 Tax=Canna indica TaxID=4628 RepID=A0AAQ3QCR8_9LILI|nr:hypothetical protein Cni_G13493 [Canna indica]
MKQWVKELVFNFKGNEVRFLESDVALLLGLPNHGEIISTPKEASEATCEGYMKDKFFPDGAAPSRTQIEDIMIQVHGSNNYKDIEDFCRLYILYVFSCILFCTPGYRVPGYLLGYVDNLNDIKYCQEHINRYLRRQMREKIRQKKRSTPDVCPLTPSIVYRNIVRRASIQNNTYNIRTEFKDAEEDIANLLLSLNKLE